MSGHTIAGVLDWRILPQTPDQQEKSESTREGIFISRSSIDEQESPLCASVSSAQEYSHEWSKLTHACSLWIFTADKDKRERTSRGHDPGRGGVESEQWRNPQPTTQAAIVHHPSTRPQTDSHDQLRQLGVVYSANQSTAGQWRTLGNIQK